jgi:hypothetical protein
MINPAFAPSSPLRRPSLPPRAKIVLFVAWTLTSLLWGIPSSAADPPAGPAMDGLAVIVSTAFPENQITLPDLKRIYLGQRLFSGRIRLKTLHSQDLKLRESFLKQVLDMTWPEFRLYCLIQLCKDGVYDPRMLTDSEMIKAVQSDEGSLGYIPWREASAQPNVRILMVLPSSSAQ